MNTIILFFHSDDVECIHNIACLHCNFGFSDLIVWYNPCSVVSDSLQS